MHADIRLHLREKRRERQKLKIERYKWPPTNALDVEKCYSIDSA